MKNVGMCLSATQPCVCSGRGGREVSDGGFLGVFIGLVCINIHEKPHLESSQPANQPANQSHTVPDIPQPSFPPTFPLFSPLPGTATRFDSLSTCYLPSFTSKWEILQVVVTGSALLMLFEVHVFSLPLKKTSFA